MKAVRPVIASNEIGRIVQHIRKSEEKKEGTDGSQEYKSEMKKKTIVHFVYSVILLFYLFFHRRPIRRRVEK